MDDFKNRIELKLDILRMEKKYPMGELKRMFRQYLDYRTEDYKWSEDFK